MIEAPNKASRRLLLLAVNNARGNIRCSPFLNQLERDNKQLVYKNRDKLQLHVEDWGDMVAIREANAQAFVTGTPVDLSKKYGGEELLHILRTR